MNAILQEPSTADIITAIEENLFFLIPILRKWPQAEVYEGSDIKWSITGIPFPAFNNIMCAQLAPERIEATIQATISRARSRNVPLLWWISPTTQPADLGSHLEKHGFIDKGQLPGMAVILEDLNESLPMPGGLTIQRVTDDKASQQWCRTLTAGFGMPDFVGDAFYDLMHYMDHDAVLAYLGWRDGQPVATSLLVLAAGVAGIYNVATIPEARRQGIGAMMTLVPLRDARDMKYRVGVLQASEMGVNVYRSLGFQEYCKIGQYVWSA